MSRSEIQKFVGALHARKARKRIFITSNFSEQAIEYAANIENNVVLESGFQLLPEDAARDVVIEVLVGGEGWRTYLERRDASRSRIPSGSNRDSFFRRT